MLVTIANGAKLHHANRMVTLKFTLAGVEHQETFLVAPLGSNQMILGMPWLERVNPDIDWRLRTLTYRHPITNMPSHDDAKPTRPCPPNTAIERSHPNAIPTHPCPPNTAIERSPPNAIPAHPNPPKPVSIEDEPCSESIIQYPTQPSNPPQPVTVEDEPCSKSTIQDPTPPTPTGPPPRKRKQIRTPVPCKTVPYRRPNPRPPNNPPIALTRRIRKGDLVALVFLNLLPEAEINSAETGSDSPKTAPEIPECYRDLADVFSEKEAHALPPHRGHLDHHIPLVNGAKPVFRPIYNLSEKELKVLKNYVEDKLAKGLIRPYAHPHPLSVPLYYSLRSQMAVSASAWITEPSTD